MLDQLRHLKEDKVYTYAGFTETGGLWSISFKFKYLRIEPHAEHAEQYLMAFKPVQTDGYYYGKGKPGLRTIRLHAGKQFIIWEGVVYPNLDARKGLKYACISVQQLPVFENIKSILSSSLEQDEINY